MYVSARYQLALLRLWLLAGVRLIRARAKVRVLLGFGAGDVQSVVRALIVNVKRVVVLGLLIGVDI